MTTQIYNPEMVELLRSIFPARGEVPFFSQGTWTPVITGSVSDPTIGYTTQYGKYTLISDVCFWSLRLQLSSISGGSGGIRISLPFTANVDGATFPVRFSNFTVTGSTPVTTNFLVASGASYGNVRTSTSGGAGTIQQTGSLASNTIIESSGMMFI